MMRNPLCTYGASGKQLDWMQAVESDQERMKVFAFLLDIQIV
jgi:hypothetical protein